MNKDKEKTFLRNLARIDSEPARKALSEKVAAIAVILASSSTYEDLNDNLELLEAFVVRVPAEALAIIQDLLKRLPTLSLTYSNEELAPYADNLTKKAIDVAADLRYLETPLVLDILFRYLDSEDAELAAFASEKLKKVAAFNLRALKYLGLAPQKALLSHIEALPDNVKKKHLALVTGLLAALLEPAAQDTTTDYKTVTWHTARLTVTDDLFSLRDGAISELIRLYGLLDRYADRRIVLTALKTAMNLPIQAPYGPALEQLVKTDYGRVIAFYNEIADTADVVELEEIESQILHFKYRGLGEGAGNAALQDLERKLAAHREYGFYKIIVADDDTYEDYWNRREDWNFQKQEEIRTDRIMSFVAGIGPHNFAEWSARISAFNDRLSGSGYRQYLPIFLTTFAKQHPALALRLLAEKHEELGWRTTPVLTALWDSELAEKARTLVSDWLEQGVHLDVISALFAINKIDDQALIRRLLAKAAAAKNQTALHNLISFSIDSYPRNQAFNAEIFLACLNALAGEEVRWQHAARFSKSYRDLVSGLDNDAIDIILDSLLQVDDISYEIEEILRPIAAAHPAKLIAFFARRRDIESKSRDENRLSARYDAIPFRLHILHEELGKHPQLLFESVYSWFAKGTIPGWDAARLLYSVFPALPPPFEQLLLQKAREGTEQDVLNVLTILREYQGDPRIHSLCKEAVMRFPDSKDVRTYVLLALDATGVVAGEFGFRDAHVRKKQETASWLEDEDPGVRAFARHYHEYLDSSIDKETLDAERDIEIRKKTWGVRPPD